MSTDATTPRWVRRPDGSNWGEFGPTGGRFIDHNDRWIWRRYAVAWLYFWLWLALPIVAMLR